MFWLLLAMSALGLALVGLLWWVSRTWEFRRRPTRAVNPARRRKKAIRRLYAMLMGHPMSPRTERQVRRAQRTNTIPVRRKWGERGGTPRRAFVFLQMVSHLNRQATAARRGS